MKMRLQCVFIYFVPGGTPYNDGQYGKASRPERGTSFRHQVYEKLGILLVEVYERMGDLSFRSVKRKGLTVRFLGCE